LLAAYDAASDLRDQHEDLGSEVGDLKEELAGMTEEIIKLKTNRKEMEP
jgi:hypothetical protein